MGIISETSALMDEDGTIDKKTWRMGTIVIKSMMVKYLILKLLDGTTISQTLDNNCSSASERFHASHQYPKTSLYPLILDRGTLFPRTTSESCSPLVDRAHIILVIGHFFVFLAAGSSIAAFFSGARFFACSFFAFCSTVDNSRVCHCFFSSL